MHDLEVGAHVQAEYPRVDLDGADVVAIDLSVSLDADVAQVSVHEPVWSYVDIDAQLSSDAPGIIQFQAGALQGAFRLLAEESRVIQTEPHIRVNRATRHEVILNADGRR